MIHIYIVGKMLHVLTQPLPFQPGPQRRGDEE